MKHVPDSRPISYTIPTKLQNFLKHFLYIKNILHIFRIPLVKTEKYQTFDNQQILFYLTLFNYLFIYDFTSQRWEVYVVLTSTTTNVITTQKL